MGPRVDLDALGQRLNCHPCREPNHDFSVIQIVEINTVQ